MAAFASDDALLAAARGAFVEGASREVVLGEASDLAARGFGAHAAALFERVGAWGEAARAYDDADDALSAARCYERIDRPSDAARALEAALRKRPDDAQVRIALGRLLLVHGKVEAAAKALQQVEASSPLRAEALPWLRRCLVELGMGAAARELDDEMGRLGVSALGDGPEGGRAGASPAEDRQIFFGRFAVAREVTVTATARIFEAIDTSTGERVAVKLLGVSAGGGRGALERFESEARAIAALRHPNIVPFVDYVAEGPAVVLGWMGGGSLADGLLRERVAPARAVEVACAALGALAAAHRLGVLHRDVKPANVLFDEAGTPRLTGFGSIHLSDLSRTATAGSLGSLAYMAPEQRSGHPATVQSDIYGVGALLAELLTGAPPSLDDGGALASAPSAANVDLGPHHDAALAALIATDPSQRPPDALAARRSLEALGWSTRARGPTAAVLAPAPAEPAASTERLGPAREPHDGRDAAARRHDAWVGRDVLVLSLDEAAAGVARAFAQLTHASLPCVLRVDRGAGALWVLPPRGTALEDGAVAPSPEQVERLAAAVGRLHEAGGAHGAIDAEHLYLHESTLALAYPRRAPDEGARGRDEAALARMLEASGAARRRVVDDEAAFSLDR